MENFWFDIFSNIIANILFWIIGGTSIWLIIWYGRRRALRQFLGIKNTEVFSIYISSYPIEKYSVKDRNGVARGHEGIAIPEYEFQTIPLLSAMISKTGKSSIPDLFKGLIDNFWVKSLPFIHFIPSPAFQNESPISSCISVGGPKFNAVTDYFIRTRGGIFFTQYKDESLKRWRIAINSGNRKGEIIGSNFSKTETDIGYIQRFVDAESNATVFLLGGLGVNGTRAAAYYLANNWFELYRRYKTKDFGIAFKCPDVHKDPDGYCHISILVNLPS